MKTILFISLFCIGLRIVSSKGMILYFLRKPYDFISGRIKELQHLGNVLEVNTYLYNKSETQLNYCTFLQYLLKPVIGCVTCMASFWTLVWSPFYEFTLLDFFLVVFPVAAVNAIGYAIYELIESKTNLNNEIRNINNKLKQ